MPNPDIINTISTKSKSDYKKINILFVDDEEFIVQSFKFTFQDEYNIFTASNAEEGLNILSKQDIGLVITDERMPEMGGIEFLSNVVDKWPDTVRIIISAYSDADRLLKAINIGHAHEYIIKPWDPDELQNCLNRSLQIVHRRRGGTNPA